MMNARTLTVILACAFGASACANLNSISRSTILPSSETTRGKAVHLDAQQRVLIINGLGQFCSEPSPDALAAFAASLGLGLSAPGTGAGSLAAGQQSSAASIGLRTQSITLMRDALFRMCEAFANGAVGPAQVATLLGRSQDLTAVILAVEQLTGAVAANQVALTGSTRAGASASLLSNQKLLDSAREDETRKQAEFDKAKADRDQKKAVRDQKEGLNSQKKAERDRLHAAGSQATDEQKSAAQAEFEQSQRDLATAQHELDAAENLVRTRETLLEESRENRQTIENNKDSALTSATAGTTGTGQFSTPVPRKELSKEATESIASAVKEMVTEVLRKDYTEEACMAMLTYIPRNWKDWPRDQKATLKDIQDLCAKVILNTLEKRIETASFVRDDSTDRIKAWVKTPENRAALQRWLDDKKAGISVTMLMFGDKFTGLRRLAVTELKIPAIGG